MFHLQGACPRAKPIFNKPTNKRTMEFNYRDRGVERQRRWPEALFRQHFPFSDFSTLRGVHFRMRYLRHSFFFFFSKISVEPHQLCIYHMSKKFLLYILRIIFARFLCTGSYDIYCIYTPNSVPSSRTDVPTFICVRKFK